MSNEPSIDEQIQNAVEGAVDSSVRPRVEPFLFYSFDLVNSTRYKSLDPDSWSELFRQNFYRAVEGAMTKHRVKDSSSYPSPLLWKRLGDEILFYQKFPPEDELFLWIRWAINTATAIATKIRNSTAPVAKRARLGIKVTIWCALITTKGTGKTHSELMPSGVNLRILESDQRTVDFIGTEIDLGFRLTKFSREGIAVLDPWLASIAYANESNKLRILAQESLKGVWHEAPIPIYAYCEDWGTYSTNRPFDELRNSHEGIAPHLEPKKVLSEVGRDGDIKLLTAMEHRHSATLIEEEVHQIHCVAICFDGDSVLVCKRSDSKKLHGGKFDFGCAKISTESKYKFDSALKQRYKQDFQLNLCFTPKALLEPIALFEIDGKTDFGLIFWASCESKDLKYNPDPRYSKIEFQKVETALDLSNHSCVPLFHDHLKKAYEMYQQSLQDSH